VPRRLKVAEGCKKSLIRSFIIYTSPNIIKVNKSRSVIWAGYIAA
jgi:hypothetical protein